MPKIAKILLLDREFVKIPEDEFEELKKKYLDYCSDTYKAVNSINGIPSKEAKDTIYNHLLSPFQYFLEDAMRLKQLDRGSLKNPWDWTKKK